MSARPESFRPHHTVDGLRVPPQSVESEQAVIGALLLSAESLWQIKGLLREQDFYRRDHRLIYRGILELARKEKPFDAVTLGEWFEANGLSDQIGGPSYLVELAGNTPSAANIRAYAEIVRDKGMLRELIEAGTEIVNNGFQPDGKTAGEVVAHAQQAIFDVTVRGEVKVKSGRELADQSFDELQAAYDKGEHELGLLTGFRDFDDATAGLQPGDFIVIAARPGIGKTVLALNMAERQSARGKKVAIWSLEMSSAQLGRRLQSSLSGVAHDLLKRPWQLNDFDWAQINSATKRMRECSLFIMDSPDLTMDELEGQAFQLHSREGLDEIIVDYLGLMTPPKAERHELAMGEISRRIKKLAKRLGIPIIGLHQLNRALESRASREPVMADLRDTGRFEQDADIIALLHREHAYDETLPDDCQLHIAKQRGGPTKRIGLNCDLAHCRFENYEGRWIPYSARKKAAKSKAGDEGFDEPAPRDHKRRAAGDDA